MMSPYRLGLRRTQALPPQADALQRPQVRRVPLEPLVVSAAPLQVVDQDPLFVIVNLLDGARVPARRTNLRHSQI